jgi:hypothetical protein
MGGIRVRLRAAIQLPMRAFADSINILQRIVNQ